MKERTADILIPHERVITLVFWYDQRLVGDVLFHRKFALSHPPTPFEKHRLRPVSAYNVSTVRASERCSVIENRKSTTHFPTSYRWSMYVTPNSPKGGSKENLSFLWIKFRFNRIKSATKFICVKIPVAKLLRIIRLSNAMTLMMIYWHDHLSHMS